MGLQNAGLLWDTLDQREVERDRKGERGIGRVRAGRRDGEGVR